MTKGDREMGKGKGSFYFMIACFLIFLGLIFGTCKAKAEGPVTKADDGLYRITVRSMQERFGVVHTIVYAQGDRQEFTYQAVSGKKFFPFESFSFGDRYYRKVYNSKPFMIGAINRLNVWNEKSGFLAEMYWDPRRCPANFEISYGFFQQDQLSIFIGNSSNHSLFLTVNTTKREEETVLSPNWGRGYVIFEKENGKLALREKEGGQECAAISWSW